MASRSPDPSLDVDFERTECCFVTLYGKLQDLEQAFRGVQVCDDTLRHGNRLRGRADRLWVEPKIDHEFLGGTGNSAEIRVTGDYF
jgi:hypothetical protein